MNLKAEGYMLGQSKIRLEVDVILRGLGIMAVVNNHAHIYHQSTVDFAGGVRLLMLVSGFAFARFAIDASNGAELTRRVAKLAWEIFWPSFLVLLLSFLVRRQFDWRELLYISHWYSAHQIALYMSWYVQVILQILLLVGALFAYAPYSRWFHKAPFHASLATFSVCVLVRLSCPLFWDTTALGNWLPHLRMWNFVLGWVAYYAIVGDRRQGVIVRRLTTWILGSLAAFFLVQPGSFEPVFLVAGTGLLLFVRELSLPKLVGVPLALSSQAVYTIYLTHMIAQGLYRAIFKIQSGFLSFIFSMVVCVAFWICIVAFKRAFEEVSRNRHWHFGLDAKRILALASRRGTVKHV